MRATQCPDEQRASYAIKPGDRICAVNGERLEEKAKFDEIVSAASSANPLLLNLKLERMVSDVMAPPGVGCTIFDDCDTISERVAQVETFRSLPASSVSSSSRGPSASSARSAPVRSCPRRSSSLSALGDRRRASFGVLRSEPTRRRPRCIHKLLSMSDLSE